MIDSIKNPSGYWVNPQSGEMVASETVVRAMTDMQVVLVGEIHNRFDIHLWQLHVAELLVKAGKPIVMGFEMFPRSSQAALDNFVEGNISVEEFLANSNWQKVWGFEASLYMPLFLFCRAHRIPMVALNCYRALVSRVGKDGWEAVPEEERDGLTPAKPASPSAREYLFEITGGQREGRAAQTADDAAFDRFVRAQGVWDRAFACNIAAAISGNPDAIMVGIIGRGHMEYGHGTPFQLQDLGVERVGLLLTQDNSFDENTAAHIADYVFILEHPQTGKVGRI